MAQLQFYISYKTLTSLPFYHYLHVSFLPCFLLITNQFVWFTGKWRRWSYLDLLTLLYFFNFSSYKDPNIFALSLLSTGIFFTFLSVNSQRTLYGLQVSGGGGHTVDLVTLLYFFNVRVFWHTLERFAFSSITLLSTNFWKISCFTCRSKVAFQHHHPSLNKGVNL